MTIDEKELARLRGMVDALNAVTPEPLEWPAAKTIRAAVPMLIDEVERLAKLQHYDEGMSERRLLELVDLRKEIARRKARDEEAYQMTLADARAHEAAAWPPFMIDENGVIGWASFQPCDKKHCEYCMFKQLFHDHASIKADYQIFRNRIDKALGWATRDDEEVTIKAVAEDIVALREARKEIERLKQERLDFLPADIGEIELAQLTADVVRACRDPDRELPLSVVRALDALDHFLGTKP